MSYYEKLSKIMAESFVKDYNGNKDKDEVLAVVEPAVYQIYCEYGNDPGTMRIMCIEINELLKTL